HPSRDQVRVEPIEPEDDEFLSELSGRAAAAARDERRARQRQCHRERQGSRSACLHRDRNYCNRATAGPWAATGWCTLKTGRAPGIDFGKRRIGLALSDPTGLLARPWKAIARRGEPQAVADELARMI